MHLRYQKNNNKKNCYQDIKGIQNVQYVVRIPKIVSIYQLILH